MTLEVRVQCYSGYKGDERPEAFFLGETRRSVAELLDRWYGEEADYFKLLADDGYTYILRRDRASDRWTLQASRRAEASGKL